MSGTFVCPRCSASMKIADGLEGHYAFCPKCEGRVWVSASDSAGMQGATPQPATPEPPLAAPAPSEASPDDLPRTQTAPPKQAPSDHATPVTPKPTAPPKAASPEAPPVAQEGPTPPPTVATPIHRPKTSPRRVAKFITADVAQSRLELAIDGELPQLTLAQGGGAKQKKVVSQSGSQWRIVLLVCGSLVVSALLLLVGPDESSRSKGGRADNNRAEISQRYIGKEGEELKTYQLYLRKALLAHSHGDVATERRYYRKVLHLLRSEDLDLDPNGRGLTGLRHRSSDGRLPSDSELQRLLSELLATK